MNADDCPRVIGHNQGTDGQCTNISGHLVQDWAQLHGLTAVSTHCPHTGWTHVHGEHTRRLDFIFSTAR
eukprot:12901584-Prorocentrum_lima.AAC.1